MRRLRFDLYILLFCLGMTLLIWQWGIAADQTEKRALMKEREEIAHRLEAYTEHVLDYGVAVAGLYVASDEVTDQDLSRFVQVLVGSEESPAILRFSHLKRLGPKEYRVTQVVDTQGEVYTSSSHNVWGEPKASALIEQVIASHEGMITWVEEASSIAGYQGAGFLVSTPLIRDGALVGLVNVVLSRDEITKEIASWMEREMAWHWWASGQGIIATSEKKITGPSLTEQVRVQLPGGSAWGIDMSIANLPSPYWHAALGIGTLFSFLMYSVVYGLSSAGVRAASLAQEMTQELQQYKLALDSTNTHVVITDPEGVLMYANPAAQMMTGYSWEEMQGSTPRLWGGQMPKAMYEHMWHTIKEEKQIFRGELTNRRKSGEAYIARSIISPILEQGSGTLLGYVGLEDDITEAKHQQEELQAKNLALENSKLAMLNLLEDAKLLEQQLKEEKASVERQVEVRTKELSQERAELLAVINSISRGLLVVDRSRKAILQNKAIESITHQGGQLNYLQVADFLRPIVGLEKMVDTAFANKQEVREDPHLLGSRYLVVHAVPVMHGSEVGAVAIFVKDVTEAVVTERSRDEFFSIASHELRTPLTAIRGNAQMIIDKYRDQKTDQELNEMLTDIHTGSVRLIEIVNDFLNVSRLEMGKMTYKIEDVSVYKLVSEVLSEMEAVRPNHQVKLEFDTTSLEGVVVQADYDRLKQVMINLVGNALKFTTQGVVRIEAVQQSKACEIRVVDSGTGIAQEQQGLLFHKFQQAGSSLYTRDTSRGTGLGLYIAKLMVEGMRGTIYLVESHVGKGSIFAISLPTGKS